jgi:hypothetical protein
MYGQWFVCPDRITKTRGGSYKSSFEIAVVFVHRIQGRKSIVFDGLQLVRTRIILSNLEYMMFLATEQHGVRSKVKQKIML